MKLQVWLWGITIPLTIVSSPVSGVSEEPRGREAIVSFLESPRQISQVEWMLLRWNLRLVDPTVRASLLDEFQREEKCSFGEISFDPISGTFKVPVLCASGILKNPSATRLEVIESWALRYLRAFDLFTWSGSKSSKETLQELKAMFVFEASAYITNRKNEVLDIVDIGQYAFGRKVPSREMTPNLPPK